MSQENVELTYRIYDAFNRRLGDFHTEQEALDAVGPSEQDAHADS